MVGNIPYFGYGASAYPNVQSLKAAVDAAAAAWRQCSPYDTANYNRLQRAYFQAQADYDSARSLSGAQRPNEYGLLNTMAAAAAPIPGALAGGLAINQLSSQLDAFNPYTFTASPVYSSTQAYTVPAPYYYSSDTGSYIAPNPYAAPDPATYPYYAAPDPAPYQYAPPASSDVYPPSTLTPLASGSNPSSSPSDSITQFSDTPALSALDYATPQYQYPGTTASNSVSSSAQQPAKPNPVQPPDEQPAKPQPVQKPAEKPQESRVKLTMANARNGTEFILERDGKIRRGTIISGQKDNHNGLISMDVLWSTGEKGIINNITLDYQKMYLA